MRVMIGGVLQGMRRMAGAANRKSIGAGLVFSLLSTAVVIAAVSAEGTSATNVQLNDGSVWVVDHGRNRVGRLNTRINELDYSAHAAVGADVLQDGRNVLFSGSDGGVNLIDVLGGGFRSSPNEIDLANYRVGAGLAALVEPSTGDLWVGRSDSVVAAKYPDGADVRVPKGSRVVVTDSISGRVDRFGQSIGALLVITPDGWFEMPLDDQAKPDRGTTPDVLPSLPAGTGLDEPLPFELPDLQTLSVPFAAIVGVSSVGDTPIVLTADGILGFPGVTSERIPGEGIVLQQPGRRAAQALVASSAGLFAVDMGDGSVEQLSDQQGVAAAPVRVGSCERGAWTSDTPTTYLRCNGVVRFDGRPIVGATPGEPLVWRVNQGNVALNSPGDGGIWADHEGEMAFVGNWDDVEPKALKSEKPSDSIGESLQFVERTCIDGGDNPPTAGDDELGARRRQTILNLLTNDDDVNCEPIAVDTLSPDSGPWGQLTIIDNGQHVLYSPSDEWIAAAQDSPQPFEFTYVVADSSGHRSTPATVSITVKDFSINAAPQLLPKSDGTTREMRTVVEEGRAVSYDVLGDWIDPDGDQLRLVRAFSEGGGEISSTPEGLVRFGANGVVPGVVNVQVTMSDGLLATTEIMEVTVKPTGSELAPVVSDDFATVVVGSTATVEPLANDSDPNEDRLDLRALWNADEQPTGYRIEQPAAGVLELTGLEAGVYALKYGAYDGVDLTEGTIRLVVLDQPESNSAPIAVPDQVKIRANRVINVDVLSNDVDLDGDILSVTNVRVGGSDGTAGSLGATVIDRELIQLEVRPGPNGEPPTGPFTLTYQVSDGQEALRAARQSIEENQADALRSLGAVTVLVQTSTEDQPPLLEPDRSVVRSGDVVAIPVLRNDVDPDGDPITLASVDPIAAAELEAQGEGTVWVEGRQVYFQGAAPGQYSILYNVEAGGRQASAEVTVEVRPLPDAGNNQAPAPPDLTLRAVRNGEVRLAIPLFNVDPDGDSVEVIDGFTGLQGAAGGNRVRLDPEIPNVVIFDAGERSGPTDSFTYTVRDRFGARGSATVNVVILDIEGPPQAFDDVFIGKPGRTISIPVLANDSSPLDRRLEMEESPFFDRDGQPTRAPVNPGVVLLDQSVETNRGRVQVVVPAADEPTLVEHYRISDGRNGSSAYIRVSGDPDTPNLPPIANPDIVSVDDLDNPDFHLVSVLDNDVDPDDVNSPLLLDMPAGQNGEVVGNQVRVNLTELTQTILYRITDADGAETIGQIRVPGKQNTPPRLSAVGLDPNERRILAASPAPLGISLLDIVEDPDGDNFELTATEVKVLGSLGSVVRHDDGLGFTFTPPPELQYSQTIAIAFEVTDRPDQTLDQRQLPNCNCVQRLEVEVTIEAASPPRVLAEGAVSIPQLDEPVVYDLAPLTIDDQNDELTYVIDQSTLSGLTFVSQAGSEITLVSERAGGDKIPIGTDIRIRYTVQDSTFEPVENGLIATIIQTNKGEPTTTPIVGVEAIRDQTYVDLPNLVDRAFNPFADSSRPLTLENASISPATATFDCTVDGNCTFLTDTVGVYTATYTLRDSVDQTITETIEINVKGLPRAPGIPSIDLVGDHSITLSWTSADMQGGTLDRYVVTAVETGDIREFTSTGGVFDGLINGNTYHFTVYAVNEIGDGDVSSQSSPGIPDRVPSMPEALAITDYQDQTLTLQWIAPSDSFDYTAITQYEVSVGGYSVIVDSATTSVNIGPAGMGGALLNGTPYTFRVRAQNSATTNNGWGAWSGDSLSETPSRFPDAPTGVAAVNSGDGGQPRLSVSWTAPYDGGRPIDSYQVCRVQTPFDCQTITTGLQATFNAGRNSATSFVVTAFNSDKNRNNSNPSGASALVTAVGTPDAPVINSITSATHTLTVNATTTNNSGCSSYYLEYSRDGGTTWQTANVFSGLTNGTRYSFIARTQLSVGCYQQYTSPNSGSAAQTPYGPLVPPSITAWVSGTQIRWNWHTNRSDDGRPGWTAQLTGHCGTTNLPTGMNQTGWTVWQDFGYSARRSCTITVSATGVGSLARSASATTAPPPVPVASIAIGPASTGPCWSGGSTQGCYDLRITLTNFIGTQTVRCFSSMNTATWHQYYQFSATNGTYNNCSYTLAGRWVVVVVGGGSIEGNNSETRPVSFPGGSTGSNVIGQWPTN